jgi:hypothetical protein
VCGATLVILTVASAGLAIAGIWGAIEGETAGQLFLTFVTVGLTSSGVTYIADSFFS